MNSTFLDITMDLISDPKFTGLIERHSARINDPVERLKFVRTCGEVLSGCYPGFAVDGGSHYEVLHRLARAAPGIRGELSVRDRVGIRAASVLQRAQNSGSRTRFRPNMALAFSVGLLMTLGVATSPSSGIRPPAVAENPSIEPAANLPFDRSHASIEIWTVEQVADSELFSNGLRVSSVHQVSNVKRSYQAFQADAPDYPADEQWRSAPPGIVYHTTVSEVSPPLEKENNELIRTRSRGLLNFVAKGKLYNFVIDRFGQVYRIVAADEVTYHAGYSAWADDDTAYLNLNDSFIGIAFETRPEALNLDAPTESRVTPAQVSSARLLTEVLRAEYGIPEQNCVTHEMVSVNPDNMRIGYHTDFAGRFPFSDLGLPNNYELRLSSIAQWGFTYDDDFVEIIGGEIWPGMRRAQTSLYAQADEHQLTPAQFRDQRQAAYRKTSGRMRIARRSRAGEKLHD